MKRTLVAAVWVLRTLASREALAREQVIEIGVKAGYGVNPTDRDPNPFGVGFGVRGGVAIAGFYGGLSVVNDLGSDNGGFSQHALLWGLEAGYGFSLFEIFTIRPQCGFGGMTMWQTVNAFRFTQSRNDFYLEPGVTALVGIGAVVFAGVDLNLLVVPGVDYHSDFHSPQSTWVTPTFHAQVGIKF